MPLVSTLLRAAVLVAVLAGPAHATITGVCPDGSMFIVKKEADIPCARAREVDPQDMPPIRPHYLPRPYAWELHQQAQDPNNPYNLVERGERIREFDAGADDEADRLARQPAPPPEAEVRRSAGPPSPPTVASAPPRAETLALGADDTRDLGLIVELSQDRVPAHFARGEPPTLTLDLAHSPAFEARLRDWYADEALGPVVLFKATAVAPEAFHANLTFVQGHHAFTPDHADPHAFGLLDGELGVQPPGGTVLGYAVLPDGVDLTSPLDVYWNDHRISVVLRP